jgi:hypothetical protein
MEILPKVAPETARKQGASVLATLALHDMQLTMIQIHMVKFQQGTKRSMAISLIPFDRLDL